MLLTSIVDLMSHPESVAFEMNHARKVIWVWIRIKECSPSPITEKEIWDG